MLDLHAHILPGLDDGAPDLETALTMARIAVADGIQVMSATPHYLEGSMENNKDLILHRVSEFQQALDEAGIALSVKPGAEIYLSPETPKQLEYGELMTVNNQGKHLLVELPMQSVPDFAEEILFELKVFGITPLIAHPERNIILGTDPERVLAFAAKGYLLQINSGSITGLYGENVKKTAHLFIKNDLIHLIGSDAHSTGGRSPKIREALDIVERLKPGKAAEIIDNGKKVLAGEEVAPEAPAEIRSNGRNIWDRIKSYYMNEER